MSFSEGAGWACIIVSGGFMFMLIMVTISNIRNK